VKKGLREELDLTDPSTLRAVARRFGVRPRAAYGQHFLIDAGVREAIVDSLGPGPSDTVLEVGPGLGTLTQALARRALRVVAVEVDPACVAALGLTLHRVPGCRVVLGDIRRVDPAGLGLPPGHLAAGNLPYHLTGVILERLLAWDPAPAGVVVVVQREVGRRLAAPAGDWSLATLAVRLLAQVELVQELPPAMFWPAPRVHSALLRLRPEPGPGGVARARLLGLARPIFQARRKQLGAAIAPVLGLTVAEARGWLGAVGLDPTRRPGTLDCAEWQALRLAVDGGGGPRVRVAGRGRSRSPGTRGR